MAPRRASVCSRLLAERATSVDQATTLSGLLHHDTRFPDGARVLEVGCGIGAQTTIIAAAHPGARIVSVENRSRLAATGPRTRRAAAPRERPLRERRSLPAAISGRLLRSVFVCFVLEHVSQPLEALAQVRRVLKPGGA